MVIEATQMTNSDFLHEVYGPFEEGTYGWVCNFRADPSNPPPGAWDGRNYGHKAGQAALIDRATEDNVYFCTSVLVASDQGVKRRKENFYRLACLVLDDVQYDAISQFSWLIETSPGKFQCGILLDVLDPDVMNAPLLDKLMNALSMRGGFNDKSGNGLVRYVRLPRGCNTKPRPAGVWEVKLHAWDPKVRWSLDDACAAFGIDLDNLKSMPDTTAKTTRSEFSSAAGEMLQAITHPDPNERAYHDNIVRLAATLVASGMFPGAAVDFIYSVMDQNKPAGLEQIARWEARRAEVPRAVKSAEKFAPAERQQAVTVNLNIGSSDEPLNFKNDVPSMDWATLEGLPPEPTEWNWEGWFPKGTVTLLSAHGGVGKSNLSLQLGVALAHGKPLFGVATKPSKVLVISAEDEARTVHFRVANICDNDGLTMSSLSGRMDVYDLTQHDCVLWRDGHMTERMQWLADLVVSSGAETLIIDNASDVFADNENDRTAVRGFMRALNLVAHKTGCAILLLAHVDKASVRSGAGLDSNTTFSGSTAWNNSARSRWAMVRDGNMVTLRHEKCNLGPLMDEISIEFDPVSKVFGLAGSNPSLHAAATVLRNSHRAAILKAISAAVRSGQKLSISATANNNAYRVLKNAPGFPRIERGEFFSVLFEMQREGLLDEVEYVNNRRAFKCLVLTQAGETRVAIGSGAPPTWAQ